jgi:F0F1-type ATP synthase membrane subunit b/b'
MVVWISLIGGIIIGWVIEWVIDWVYWRRGAEAFFVQEQELRRELAEARRQAEEAQAALAELQEPRAEQSAGREPATSTGSAPGKRTGNDGERRTH